MKKLPFAPWWILLVILNCPAEEMNPSNVKQLVRQMDDSLARGNIYHINYSVVDKRTDSFYNHRQELIQVLHDAREKDARDLQSNPQNAELAKRQQSLLDTENDFKHQLLAVREREYLTDFNVDEIGFYMKREHAWLNNKGEKMKDGPTIYASDGKIMGTFYLNDAQAVIQPATERPQVPEEHWSDIAYLFNNEKIPDVFEEMNKVSLRQNDKMFVIMGELAGPKKQLTQLELHIDKSSLEPVEITAINYGSFGQLIRKLVKKWQYQDFSGISLPRIAIEQTYETDVSGKLNMEQERIFTINDFSPGAKSSKESFKGLLKSSFSIYDEITGSHYISGNPEEMLDKLSR